MTTTADPASTDTDQTAEIPAVDPQQPADPGQDTTSAPDTDEDTAPPARRSVKDRAAQAVTGWWAWIAEPMALAEAWRRSSIVDPRRIPADSPLAAWFWWWSNRTDRVLLFALLLICPTFLNGPLLYCAERPTRRWGLYLVVALLAAITFGS